jgi:prevent-host-death family protein
MGIKYAYNKTMDVSVAEARKRLPELIHAMEGGETIVITRHGKPVAEIGPPPAQRRLVKWGSLRGQIHLKPGWDDPIDEDKFLAGEY